MPEIPHQGAFLNNEVTNLKREELWPDYSPPPASLTSQFGWFSGGVSPSIPGSFYSAIDRLTYASDTAGTIFRANLPEVTDQQTGGMNDIDHSWLAGGRNNATSSIYRITFANDTTNAVYRGETSGDVSQSAGASNGTAGWFVGENSPACPVRRLIYASDTAGAEIRTTWNFRRSNTGNSNGTYAWFAGGLAPGATNSIGRLEYANDTAAESDRSDLTIASFSKASVNNSVNAWFAGGNTPPTITNIVDRITFANDTVNAIDRCDLTVARSLIPGSTDGTHAWFIAGASPAVVNVIDRITLASDTTNAVDRGDAIKSYSSSASACNTFGVF